MPTKDRPDYVIRQLRYYAKVKCPHTIYVGDSSKPENTDKIKTEISALKNMINIVYEYRPVLTGSTTVHIRDLAFSAKEKYVCFSGDDDYQIPDALTECSEFLENNADYATVCGHAVNFRIMNNTAYGELNYIADYPRFEIQDSMAGGRLLSFFSNYFTSLFSVQNRSVFLNGFDKGLLVKDSALGSELLPCTLSIIAGKAKILDRLGLVRQMHGQHIVVADTYDWITGNPWASDQKIFEKEVITALAKKDGIDYKNACIIFKQAFWAYLCKQLNRGYLMTYPKKSFNTPKLDYYRFYRSMRAKIGKNIPLLKRLYSNLTGNKQIHYEVLQPHSPYYKDFKPVMDSFIRPSPKSPSPFYNH